MPTAVTSQKIGSRNSIECLAHVPGSAAATIVTPGGGVSQWRAMSQYELFGFLAANVVLVGAGITLMEILGATDINGGNATLILASGVLTGAGLGNGGFLEIVAQQIREVGSAAGFNFSHVAGRITVANSGDKCAVTYLRAGARHPGLNLTPATF